MRQVVSPWFLPVAVGPVAVVASRAVLPAAVRGCGRVSSASTSTAPPTAFRAIPVLAKSGVLGRRGAETLISPLEFSMIPCTMTL